MLSKSILFQNFKIKTNLKSLKNKLKNILKRNNEVINSLGKNYKNNFESKKLKKKI